MSTVRGLLTAHDQADVSRDAAELDDAFHPGRLAVALDRDSQSVATRHDVYTTCPPVTTLANLHFADNFMPEFREALSK